MISYLGLSNANYFVIIHVVNIGQLINHPNQITKFITHKLGNDLGKG